MQRSAKKPERKYYITNYGASSVVEICIHNYLMIEQFFCSPHTIKAKHDH